MTSDGEYGSGRPSAGPTTAARGDGEPALTVAVVLGTSRAQRRTHLAAELIAEVGRESPGLEVLWVDPRDFTLPGDGNDPEAQDPRYVELVARCDAFFIVCPEYNHGYPGTLKRLLDSELAGYNHKAVAFAGTSATPWGGVRAIEALVGVVRELGLVASSEDVYFPRINELFPDDTVPSEVRDAYQERIRRAWRELCWLGRALADARDGSRRPDPGR